MSRLPHLIEQPIEATWFAGAGAGAAGGDRAHGFQKLAPRVRRGRCGAALVEPAAILALIAIDVDQVNSKPERGPAADLKASWPSPDLIQDLILDLIRGSSRPSHAHRLNDESGICSPLEVRLARTMLCVYARFSRPHFNLLNAWMVGTGPAMTTKVRGAAANELPTAIAISAAIFLDKIRNTPYLFLLTESLPARRRPGRARRGCGCLKTELVTTRRASRRERNVFLLHRPQPIEKSRFEKINASKR
jgi:hypothetical protein